MSDTGDADEEGSTAAADAFALLADGTRLAILETLLKRGFGEGDFPIGFADLRRAVGIEDAGQFNYHLEKLRPQFVEKTDGGYSPRSGALEAVGAARAGSLTDRPTERRAELETTCLFCDESLTATHEGSQIRVTCPEHGVLFQMLVPPQVAMDRSVPEVVRYAWREVQRDIERMTDGACMICAGPVEHEVPAGIEPDAEDGLIYVAFTCDVCGLRTQMPLELTIVRHPSVVAHHYTHGIDGWVGAPSLLSFSDWTTTVVSEDPFEAQITVPVEGDDLTLRVNADLEAEEC